MNKKAVVLLSGGLDSTLAACIIKAQGIQLEALNFQTMFGCCKDDARRVAHKLGIAFTLLKVGDDYLKVIEHPKYGYGKGINPCVDCRIYMFDLAKKFMEETGASFLISGEVLGQRPMSQKKRDFEKIERDNNLVGRILRPLSAKLLPVTEPERAGIIDRSKLYDIQGRSRQDLVRIAEQFGITEIPQPSPGCALTTPPFAKKVKDVFDHNPDYKRWEFEILKVGRHFRLDVDCKVILSRNESEGEYLESFRPEGTVLLTCANFAGPTALLAGEKTPERLRQSAALVLRYAQKPLPEPCEILVRDHEKTETWLADLPADEAALASWRIV